MTPALPLEGRHVLITRPKPDAASLVKAVHALGGTTIVWSAIAIQASQNSEALTAAIQSLGIFDWLVFSSANAVGLFAASLDSAGILLPDTIQIAVIGPSTADAVKRRSWTVARLAETHIAEGLIAAMAGATGRVLLPQAEDARPVLAEGLRSLGLDVHTVVAYRTIGMSVPASVVNELQSGSITDVILMSGSAACALAAGVNAATLPARIITIGPETARVARSVGLTVTRVADQHTEDGVIAALVEKEEQ